MAILFKIGDWIAPTPSEYKNIPQEIVKASRAANGTLIKYRIAVKQSITVKWNALTREQMQELAGKTGGNAFNLEYFDQESGTMKNGLFYRGSDYDVTGLDVFDRAGPEINTAAIGHRHYTVTMSFVEF